MKKDIKLKGQLKLYMQWPGIMILFLILMNIWIFRMDRKAGLLMSAFVLVYAVVIGIMYFYNKSLILADMVEFAAQYGIVQNTLLKELSIPYAILLDDGKIIWPGNVRELQHTVERAVILGDGSLLRPENFMFQASVSRQKKEEEVLNLEQLERQAVERAMRLSEGNVTRAAEYLGITRFALYRKLEKLGL